jgi:NNP family nitrate/nitrite transporter-like MFS transporter
VGLIGGLGGFILPIAFGMMNDFVGVWTSCFMLLFGIASVSLLWMHAAVLHMQKQRMPELAIPQYIPEVDILGSVLPARGAAPAPAATTLTKRSAPEVIPAEVGTR